MAVELRAEPAIGQITERLDPRFFLDHAYLPIAGRAPGSARLDEPATRVGRVVERAMAWLEDSPASTSTPPGNIAEALSVVLEGRQRRLSADEVPTGLDWNRMPWAEGMADGYFAARDGRMRFLFVRARNASQDFGPPLFSISRSAGSAWSVGRDAHSA
ncbi:MAG: hypothetical protein ACREWE_04695 [Gammaproteobacteria bacterium]